MVQLLDVCLFSLQKNEINLASEWNISTTTGWITMKFGKDVHGLLLFLKLKNMDHYLPLSLVFHKVQLLDICFFLLNIKAKREISRQLLDGLAWSLAHTFMVSSKLWITQGRRAFIEEFKLLLTKKKNLSCFTSSNCWMFAVFTKERMCL